MKKAALEWILSYAEKAYWAHSKVDSFQDRFRNLIPLYAALGTGYFYFGVRFPHYYTDGNFAFFYAPYSVGLILLLVSISLLLFGMFWKSEVHIMPGPLDIFRMCEQFQEQHSEDSIKQHLDKAAAEAFCYSTQANIINIKQRSELLVTAGKIGVISFILLMVAAPRFVSTLRHHTEHINSTITAQ